MQLADTKRIFEILRFVAASAEKSRVSTEEIAKALHISQRQAAGDVGRMVAAGFLSLTPGGRVYLNHTIHMAASIAASTMAEEGWCGEGWETTVSLAKSRNERTQQFWKELFGDTPFGEPRKQDQEPSK
jgi:hypothetical protein